MKYFEGRNSPVQGLGCDANLDGEYEDDSAGGGGVTLKDEQGEGEDWAVLVAGSFSACVRSLGSPSG